MLITQSGWKRPCADVDSARGCPRVCLMGASTRDVDGMWGSVTALFIIKAQVITFSCPDGMAVM